MRTNTQELGPIAAATEDDPNVLWFAEECQSNNVRIDALIHSAELARDPEMAAFFRRAKQVLQGLSGVQGLSQAA